MYKLPIVTFEQAKKLKMLGLCKTRLQDIWHYYDENGNWYYWNDQINEDAVYYAPYLELVRQWFYSKGYIFNIDIPEYAPYTYSWWMKSPLCVEYCGDFDSYNDALTDVINKCIDIYSKEVNEKDNSNK